MAILSCLFGILTTVVTTPAVHADTSANLIVNGDAESSTCGTPYEDNTGGITGWTTVTGTPNVVCNNYGDTHGGFPASTTSGTPTGSHGYFSGGTSTTGKLTQTVSFTDPATTTAIDAHNLNYTLSGLFGNDGDAAQLNATFRDINNQPLGTVATIGPDTSPTIQFVNKTTTGTIPANTRSITLDLISTRASGTVNDGYADNLSLITTTTAPSTNLIVNGDAESTTCVDPYSDNVGGITGWTTTTGTPNVACNNYGDTHSGFPASTTPGTPTGSHGYFSGGHTHNSGGLTQTVDVSGSATAIDAGTLAYTLSGWFGGDGDDTAELHATFRNASGAQLGAPDRIGPVTSADRGGIIQFLQRTTTGTIPAGTRSIKLDLLSTRASGTIADGYADNLSLTTNSIAANQNLILDGNAEAAVCSTGYDEMTVPGWSIDSGNPDVVCYDNPDSTFANLSTPGEQHNPTGARPSNGYFSGGPSASSQLHQTVNVSTQATAIDNGTATYNLSGWLGGQGSDADNAKLVATFLSSTGPISTAQLGPVTAADRGNVTKFLQRTANGPIPTGTRTIQLDLTFSNGSGDATNGYAANLSLTMTPSITVPTLTTPTSTVPGGYDHVFMIFMENTDYADIIGPNSQAPKLTQLANNNTLLTNYHATTHSSDPNYVSAMFGTGHKQTGGGGVYNNNCINDSACTYAGPNLASMTEDAGKTWKEYDEGAIGNCDHTAHDEHDDDTVTFYFWEKMKNDQTYCDNHHQPLTQMYTDLQSTATTPNYVWFGALLTNNMHSGGYGKIATGDTWLNDQVNQIKSTPAWTTQKSLLLITWDEDDQSIGIPGYNTNQVATIVLDSPNANKVKHGFTSNTHYDHYSLDRTVESALGLPAMTSNDAYATPMNDIFN